MKNLNFYICEKCGNIVEMIYDSGVNPVCCGQKMTKLVAGVVDASREKHVPVVTLNDNSVKVSVGAITHPMSDEHNIAWICLHTENGAQLKYLAPDEAPEAVFSVENDKPIAAYAYCNLHGLWKTDI